MSIQNWLGKFWQNRSGNVGMMFGLALVPMMAASGAAIDYSRFSNARSALSAAADAGALAGSINRGSVVDRKIAAQSVFEANLKQSNFTTPVVVNYINIIENSQNVGYRIEASGDISTLFGAFIGNRTGNITATAEAKSATDTPLDIAFVLDTTGSMEGARLTALKSATNNILDEIGKSSLKPGMVRTGVVPFAEYVNVGMSNRNKPWISVPADFIAIPTVQCTMEYPKIGETNCRDVPGGTYLADGVTKSYPGYRACDPVYGTTQINICRPVAGPSQIWYGCVGSRNYPLNTRDSDYSTRIPAMMNIGCASPLQELTTNISATRVTINGLAASGNTYLPAGLIWGRRMLSKNDPLSAPQVNGMDPRKFMILVTDGRNTISPNYPDHWGSDVTLANNLTRETCNNIANDKLSGIKVFTIAFEMDGLETKTILQECAAKSGGQFFDANNAQQLQIAMNQALQSIMRISLVK